MIKKVLFSIIALCVSFNLAYGASKEEMVQFVKEGVAYAKKHGKEKSLEAFTKSTHPDFSKFQKGELYMYAYDYEGVCIGHGAKEALVNKNLINMQDANKKLMIKELRDTAKKGSGFVEFKWQNPISKKVEDKLGYVEKVDDTWWIGSGIYFGK